jgi:hypothetical protein
MKDLKEQFEKFDLLPLSHSRINSYIEHKADFVAKYIYGNQMPSTPSMTRALWMWCWSLAASPVR